MKASDWIKNLTEIQERSWLDGFSQEEVEENWLKVRFFVWKKLLLIKEPEAIKELSKITQLISQVEIDNHSNIPYEKRVLTNPNTGDRMFAKFNKNIWDNPYRFFDLVTHNLTKGKYTFFTQKKKKKKNYDYEFLQLLAKDLNESVSNCEDYHDIMEEVGILEEKKKELFNKYGIEYTPQGEELNAGEEKVEMVDITSIQEHPINKEIYSSSRKSEDEELEENIRLYGLLQPLVVDKNTNYIVSGNRRFQACKNLGLKKVKVIKSSFDYDIISLINFNKYRTKTSVEKVAEYRMMKSQIKKMGYKDRKELMGGMKMRDYIFTQTGVSQKTEYQLSVVEKENPKLAEMVLTGELSIKGAYQRVKKKPKTKTQETKEKIEELKKFLTYEIYPNLSKSKLLQIIDWIYDDKPSLIQQTNINPTSDRFKSMWIQLLEHYGLNDDGNYSGNDLDFYSSFVFNLQRENPKHEILMSEFFFKLYKEKAGENGWKLNETDYEVWRREFQRGKEFSNSESKFKNWMPSEEELEEQKNFGKNENGNQEFSTKVLESDTWKKRFGDKTMEDFIEEDE